MFSLHAKHTQYASYTSNNRSPRSAALGVLLAIPGANSGVSLHLPLGLVVSRHHQVGVGTHVFDGRRFVLDGGGLAVYAGNLQHPARVVFQQITGERFPATSDADHHVFVVKHLE